MATPEDAILEDPERFAKGIDLQKIKEAKDPQKQFLKEMEKKFNKKTGLYLWRYFIENKKLMDESENPQGIWSWVSVDLINGRMITKMSTKKKILFITRLLDIFHYLFFYR